MFWKIEFSIEYFTKMFHFKKDKFSKIGHFLLLQPTGMNNLTLVTRLAASTSSLRRSGSFGNLRKSTGSLAASFNNTAG